MRGMWRKLWRGTGTWVRYILSHYQVEFGTTYRDRYWVWVRPTKTHFACVNYELSNRRTCFLRVRATWVVDLNSPPNCDLGHFCVVHTFVDKVKAKNDYVLLIHRREILFAFPFLRIELQKGQWTITFYDLELVTSRHLLRHSDS